MQCLANAVSFRGGSPILNIYSKSSSVTIASWFGGVDPTMGWTLLREAVPFLRRPRGHGCLNFDVYSNFLEAKKTGADCGEEHWEVAIIDGLALGWICSGMVVSVFFFWILYVILWFIHIFTFIIHCLLLHTIVVPEPCKWWNYSWGPSSTSPSWSSDEKYLHLILYARLHPGRLTWNLWTHPWKGKNIFQTIIFRFYVDLLGV